MSAKNASGKYGEYYAAKYLNDHGYKILHRNYKCRIAEIDIVALDGNTLCFIEVKTRKDKLHGFGAEFVNKAKIEKLVLGARSYIASHNASNDIRFDVVEVYGRVMTGGFAVSEINVIKNAFDV